MASCSLEWVTDVLAVGQAFCFQNRPCRDSEALSQLLLMQRMKIRGNYMSQVVPVWGQEGAGAPHSLGSPWL